MDNRSSLSAKPFEKLPIEWVDRLFHLLEKIYSDRWVHLIGNESRKSIIKSIWSTALSGLTSSEIKHALQMCERNPDSEIPTPVEFYHYAKKNKNIKIKKYNSKPVTTSQVARRYLDKIKSELK